MRPSVVRCGDTVTISLTDGEPRTDDDMIGEELKGLVSSDSHVMLDLGRVRFIGSLELGTLISLHRRLNREGRKLTLFNLCEPIYDIFRITRLTTIMDVSQSAGDKPAVGR